MSGRKQQPGHFASRVASRQGTLFCVSFPEACACHQSTELYHTGALRKSNATAVHVHLSFNGRVFSAKLVDPASTATLSPASNVIINWLLNRVNVQQLCL